MIIKIYNDLFSYLLQLYKTHRKKCVLKQISNLLLTDNLVFEKYESFNILTAYKII